MKSKYRTLLISVAVAAALVIISALIIPDISTVGNVFVISLFIVMVPYFLIEYAEFLWLKSVERQFPNFMRDLADSKRSGMALTEAIHICSRAKYGKLTPEIKSMSNRLTWGTPFLRALDIFGERTRKSKIINEALDLIKEAYQSGGNIASTLDSVAKDIRTLQDAEDERKSLVRQHMMIMYAIFFVFLAVSMIIIYVMVPMMKTQPESGFEAPIFRFTNPCPSPSPGEIVPHFPCSLFYGACSILSIDVAADPTTGISCYYIALFFFILIIQGIFSGLIAGQLGENSVVAGAKHSFIMVAAAIMVFMFMAKLGLLPV